MPLAPVMARGPPSERALRKGPSYQLLLCFICPSLWRAARVGQLIIRAAREGQPIICLSALFAPVMARGPSSERALRRRPSYHLPFVSFAHLYGARPEWASLSFAFLLNLPPLWHAARAGQLIACLSAQFAPVMARSPKGPAYRCLAAVYTARLKRASLSFARPERASLSFARPERASLSFALMPYA